MDDQRDYAEEAANRRLMEGERSRSDLDWVGPDHDAIIDDLEALLYGNPWEVK